MRNENELLYMLWLCNLKDLGPARQRSLLRAFGTASEIYSADYDALVGVKGFQHVLAKQIIASRDISMAEKIIDDCRKLNVKVVCITDGLYPDRLRLISDMPIVLYYKGILKEAVSTVGIVGPRKCDRRARKIAINTAAAMAAQGKCIVSGMAIGVDAYAHTAALKGNAYTIAVLGCGADICYPKEHIELYDCISEKGLILSEYPPGTRPDIYYFPERNRIIAALSDELLVICPRRKSGSLITAKYAESYGKKVKIYNGDSDLI